MFSWPGWAGGLEISSLGLPSGMTLTIGVSASSGIHPSGCPAQPLYVLLLEMGGFQSSPMCLPSFNEGMFMWVFTPYPGPPREFGLAAGPQNAGSTPLWFLFWPGGTLPLPHPFFQGSADFLIKGLHLLWPIQWRVWKPFELVHFIVYPLDLLPGSPESHHPDSRNLHLSICPRG